MSKSSSRYGRRSNWFKITYFSEQMRRCNRSTSEIASLRPSSLASSFRLSYPPQSDGGNETENGASTSSHQENPTIQYPYHTSPAMLQRPDGSPHPEDVALYHQLYLRNWYLGEHQPQLSSVTSPPPTSREVSSSPLDTHSSRQQSPSTETSAILSQGTSFYSSDSYRSSMPAESISARNTRNADGSESESNDDDHLRDVQSRSSSSQSPFASTRANEQDSSKPRVSINGMLMLTGQHSLLLPGGMFTSGTHSLPPPWRCNNLLLVNSNSSNPAGDEPSRPLDLSMRSSSSPSRSKESPEKEEKEEEQDEKNDRSSKEETTVYPLDLTLSAGTSLTANCF